MKRCLLGLWISLVVLAPISMAPGCSSNSGPGKNDAATTDGNLPQGSGGQIDSGGAGETGGQVGGGGSPMAGGTIALGGIAATGGHFASGGHPVTGGTATNGGTIGTGGVTSTGGHASGGQIGAGGTQAGGALTTSGTVASGGNTATGGIPGIGGNFSTGGARVDAGSTQGCQCTGGGMAWSVPFNCYCAAKPYECEVTYASYGPDAGASGKSYTGIKEYAGCNLAVVYDMDSVQNSNKYFDLTTGRLVGLSKTANAGIDCPFGGNDGGRVFSLGTGQTTVPESCTRTACFATAREPSYCTN